MHHRNLYTCMSSHSPSGQLRTAWQPIYDEFAVDVVFQGHNHVYERFDVDGLPYVVTGGGGSGIYGLDDQVEVRPDEVPLRVAAGAFIHGVRVTITATEMHLRAIDAEGAIRDEVRFALD